MKFISKFLNRHPKLKRELGKVSGLLAFGLVIALIVFLMKVFGNFINIL